MAAARRQNRFRLCDGCEDWRRSALPLGEDPLHRRLHAVAALSEVLQEVLAKLHEAPGRRARRLRAKNVRIGLRDPIDGRELLKPFFTSRRIEQVAWFNLFNHVPRLQVQGEHSNQELPVELSVRQ